MKTLIKLPPIADELFRAFLVAPTLWKKEVKSLHPNDWKRLYLFVDHCSRYNVSLTSFELTKLLRKHDFSEELTEEICTLYKHGRRLLKLK